MTQATPNTQNQNTQHQNQSQSQNQNQNTHEGQAAEQAKPARARRARRPASSARSATPAKAASAAATSEVATPSSARAEPAAQAQPHAPQPQPQPQPQTPAHEQPAQPQKPPRARRARRTAQTPQAELPQPQQPIAELPAPTSAPAVAPAPAATAQGAETAEGATQQKKRTTRGGRGHRGGHKGEVQLVKPAETAAEQPAAPAAEPIIAGAEPAEPEIPATFEVHAQAETEPRIVPVVTEAVQQMQAPTGALGELSAEPLAAASAAATAPAAAAPSRFRFGRRSAAETAPEQPAARPAPARELSPAPAATLATLAASAPTHPPVEAHEEPESWQATVAEIVPESLPSANESAASAIDDLVAALGLQGAAPVAPLAPPAAEAVESALQAEAAEAAEAAETAAEEEHQTARRRRRRRGSKSATTAPAGEEAAVEPLTAPEWSAERELRNGYERGAEPSKPYSPYNRPPRERLAPVAEPEPPEESPFGSPEPQMARGFGPQPRGVAGPPPSALQRPARERERLETPPMSPNQLGNMLSHAIQQQTDRLLSELHHQPQGPAMTFAVPLPSTERVGIFVDVANLLYSARSQRIALDFGKLLDFLRGNRRLIRAHAYAPTNPEPGAEQSFLNAVRGLGYRITTKNFKTFASGAKKADMDLDLCMDIVRMVDAGALDTVVLVSGDSDFLPLLEYASDRGVRVEVAAFEDSAAMILRQSCDLFVNLSLVEGLQK